MADAVPRLPPLPFAEAIAWARSRRVVLPEVYYGELTELARQQAFTISGLTTLDQVEAVRDSLAAVLESGSTYRDWQARVLSGELPIDAGPARLETIFRNNIQQSYNRGRYEQQARTADTHPYLMYDAVDDSRTRPTHAAMDGYVARRDDPVWATWTPACGHRCRCRRIALSARQAERYVIQDAERMGDRARAKAREESIKIGPDPGWGSDPYQDPNAGLRSAIDGRLDDCRGGQMAAPGHLLAKRKGGCLAEAERLLHRLRADQGEAASVSGRARFVMGMETAAILASAADDLRTVWRSDPAYRQHIVTRKAAGHIRTAAEYRDAIAATAADATTLLVGQAPGLPSQMVIESVGWAIIYQDALIQTAYRKEDGEEAWITRKARNGWAITDIGIDDEVRRLLARLHRGYQRLRP